ncbi:MAG: polysaccharide deacetylase family protein [Halofilum sp. (in: g-proteobacteria)]|nr:polysaccharide deacetylase family protein [Halofilum sp. (in: g-proteobacteria)]
MLGLFLVAGPAVAASGVVLEYHHVAKDAPPSTSVDPATFDKHMDHLAENGFSVWPLPKLVQRVRAGGEVPPKTVALTFDDAYRSVYTEVLPRMRARGWPFTVFVATGPTDKGIDAYATWEQLREMEAAGATIANHSVSHGHMVRRRDGESEAAWLERLRGEVVDAQERLAQEVREPAKLFAYPYGEFSPPVQRLVRELGYVGFGQQSGAFGPHSDFAALPRFPIATAFASLDSFALKVRSRPLPVAATEPESGVLGPDVARPELRITLRDGPFRPDAVRCYVGGQPAVTEQVGEAPAVLSVRRATPSAPGARSTTARHRRPTATPGSGTASSG